MTNLQLSMREYVRSTDEIRRLQAGVQGLSKAVKKSKMEHFMDLQIEAQGEIGQIFCDKGCQAPYIVARFLFPCYYDVLSKADMQVARQSLKKLFVREVLTIGDSDGE